jgi:leucyl-tRNA---protein transferase
MLPNNFVVIDPIDNSFLDELLAKGYRHFGERFFRYKEAYHEEVCKVLPLRIRLDRFKLKKDQKKIKKKNIDTIVQISPASITEEKIHLFNTHKMRFKEGIPSSLYTFLSEDPAINPCKNVNIEVFLENKLIAVSYLDLGRNSCSSVYGFFDLNHSNRSLGIYTMLCEIEFAISNNYTYYYSGYAYDVKSFYDYKKRFYGLEYYDWKGNWRELNNHEIS